MALFGPYGIPGDVGMASDIFSASTESHLENQLPLLPPPPPASPVPSPAIDNAGPSAPKSRRSRHEVDEANILTSAHSRAPTERKRIAEEEVSSQAQKRNRRKLLAGFMNISHNSWRTLLHRSTISESLKISGIGANRQHSASVWS
ncbi:hypothetical protein B0H10DRAFT_1959763 [Mycena sp. CBHHK59/15]|nr:hypothetical protein B0H10DRAFT_1959763 [Mycena sp. CBHHK59/15]